VDSMDFPRFLGRPCCRCRFLDRWLEYHRSGTVSHGRLSSYRYRSYPHHRTHRPQWTWAISISHRVSCPSSNELRYVGVIHGCLHASHRVYYLEWHEFLLVGPHLDVTTHALMLMVQRRSMRHRGHHCHLASIRHDGQHPPSICRDHQCQSDIL
jgi:hypothetical protein